MATTATPTSAPAGARMGYYMWGAFDRPSPDHTNARVILLISSHLETGHYFNPHAQRIIEGKMKGAKIITFDPRLSNTASMSDTWLPTWPGSEQTVLLAMANYLIQNDRYDKEYVRRWVNWEDTLAAIVNGQLSIANGQLLEEIRSTPPATRDFDLFDRVLKDLYAEFTFERAAEESQVPVERIQEAAEYVANCDGKLATHTWRCQHRQPRRMASRPHLVLPQHPHRQRRHARRHICQQLEQVRRPGFQETAGRQRVERTAPAARMAICLL
jgi:anaerobic selenocysteine-containing dehydrogenase